MENNTTAIRIFFSKTGRAKYISALDLINCFQRALRRTDIPVWHTQGFNPHTYVNINLPLSLGTEGIRESMDIKLTNEMTYSDVKDKLNAVLPPDIRVTEVAQPVKKHTEIEKSVYEIFIKATALNSVYNTYVDSFYSVAQTILSLNITSTSTSFISSSPLFL